MSSSTFYPYMSLLSSSTFYPYMSPLKTYPKHFSLQSIQDFGIANKNGWVRNPPCLQQGHAFQSLGPHTA